jgi:hypothetical protein
LEKNKQLELDKFMGKIIFDKVIIEEDFLKSETMLFDKGNISIIKYFDFDHTTFDANNQDLLNGISGQSIIYCIWTGVSPNKFFPKYIGHAGNNISRQRIRAHLTKKNEATGAQLEKIKEVLKQKKCIGISIITIEPAYMRKALEDWLIDKHSEILEWNAIGRRPQTKQTHNDDSTFTE